MLQEIARHNQWEIHATCRDCTKYLSETRITWHSVDLLKSAEIDQVFDLVMPTYLVQLAWCTEHGSYWRDIKNLDWVAANFRIARAFALNGGERCLFAGTSAEYDWSSPHPCHESETALNPQMLYGACKLASYHALSAFFEQENISWAWARFFCPFGPLEDQRRLIPKTCLRLLSGDDLQLDSATSLRDFLHVEDIASALYATLTSSVQGPVNIASGEALPVREIVTQIAFNLGRINNVHFADATPVGHSTIDAVTANVSRLENLVGWRTSVPFETRLRQTCEWWINHRDIRAQQNI
jgi:nucleoside-diphosphate-sugar epimerase